MMHGPCRKTLAAGLLLASGLAAAQSAASSLAACAGIADKTQRLECFDRLASDSAAAPALTSEPKAPAAQPARPESSGTPAHTLARHWELGPEDKRGVLRFRPHQDNYALLANYSHRPNSGPYRAAGRIAADDSLSHTEVAFQLGFKMKLLENPLSSPLDLWFGYTQQSYWQAYNRNASSPIRETNYQPELMAIVPFDVPILFGIRSRFVGLGVVHQSNGQPAPLSRSWNRVYAQAGVERGGFGLIARLWSRIGDIDDNPDIVRYMGHGDLVASYRWSGHDLKAFVRQNWATGRGAVQASWAFPLVQNLKGYLQIHSGYGDSLIDYNAYQRTAGLGVLIDF